MFGYKAFHADLTCKNHFQYEIGSTYEMDGNIAPCLRGFHFCKTLGACYNYYNFSPDTRICRIEALGDIITDDNYKYCTNKIKIISEVFNPLHAFCKNFRYVNPDYDIKNGIIKEIPIGKSFQNPKNKSKGFICVGEDETNFFFSFSYLLGRSNIYNIENWLSSHFGDEEILDKDDWNSVAEWFIPDVYEILNRNKFPYYKIVTNRIKKSSDDLDLCGWWTSTIADKIKTFCTGPIFYMCDSTGYISPRLAIDSQGGIAPVFRIPKKISSLKNNKNYVIINK